jgi:hypothetical protein
MDARSLHLAVSQIEPAQICLAKVAIGEVDICDVQVAQIDAAKITAAEIALLARLLAAVEFLAASLSKQQVERIG